MPEFKESSTSVTPTETGYIGKIPVRNLWLLMLYASELFRQIQKGKVTVEENPDDIPDLVAELLAFLVERRLMRNLTHGFCELKRVLPRVRGHIDFLQTERDQLLSRGMVGCRFDNLTVDTPRNRFVRAALDKVSQIVSRPGLAQRCRALATTLKRLGVTGERPGRAVMSSDRFGRHDEDDRYMVAAAQLAFDMALPTENQGAEFLVLPDREIVWIRRLYERAVGGFYSVALAPDGWHVDTGATIKWPIERKTAGIDKIMPTMRTDVVLNHFATNRRIVIDTKFTTIVTQGWYKEETLRSGYIYQIYAYLRSQEGGGDPLACNASGLLLHPSIDKMYDETVLIQGHAIRFATVNLGGPAQEIRAQLMRMVDFPEEAVT